MHLRAQYRNRCAAPPGLENQLWTSRQI
jgi:hypothetical protein